MDKQQIILRTYTFINGFLFMSVIVAILMR